MASGTSLADDVSELKNRLNAVPKRSQSPVGVECEAPQKPYKTYGRTPDGKGGESRCDTVLGAVADLPNAHSFCGSSDP